MCVYVCIFAFLRQFCIVYSVQSFIRGSVSVIIDLCYHSGLRFIFQQYSTISLNHLLKIKIIYFGTN